MKSSFARAFTRHFSKASLNKKISMFISEENDIYFNLALENVMLNSYGLQSSPFGRSNIIFLWRNSPCIIVGCNQNLYSECNTDVAINDGVNLVRRFTGGGAVFQDLGNTCYTFISPSDDYNFEVNSKLICSSIGNLTGKECVPSGRNDLCIDGLKFSGAAFRVLPRAALHHGTLLLNLDTTLLERYLTPDKSKLKKHNVRSVKSRVVNLTSFNPKISHPLVCQRIFDEAKCHYGAETEEVMVLNRNSDICQHEDFVLTYSKLKDQNWIFGSNNRSSRSLKTRFDFGGIELCFDLVGSTAENIRVYSDSLNVKFIDNLNEKLGGKSCDYNAAGFTSLIKQDDEFSSFTQELISWLNQPDTWV